jgi:hypothetical protein
MIPVTILTEPKRLHFAMFITVTRFYSFLLATDANQLLPP